MKATIDGRKIRALLFEERKDATGGADAAEFTCPVDSSSATGATTQDSASDTIDVAGPIDVLETNAPAKAPDRTKEGGLRAGARNLIATVVVAAARQIRIFSTMLGELARDRPYRCRGPP